MDKSRIIRKSFTNGFTMIELIVTITVLAVIAAFTAPSLLGFVDDAKAKDCQSKIADIKRLYSEEAVDMGVDNPSEYENQNLVDSAVQKSGGTYSNGDSIPELSDEDREKKGTEKYRFYAGLCPKGGEYVVSFKGDTNTEGTGKVKSKVVVACTYPGHTEEQVGVSLIGLHTLENAVKDKKSTIYNYFFVENNGKGKGNHLDSTGKNYAPDVQKMLAAIGIDITENSSWRIEKINRQTENPNNKEEEWGFNIYWTEEKIDEYEVGTSVKVIKYNTGTKKYYYGTGEVKKNEAYSGVPGSEYDFVVMDFTKVNKWDEATDI